MKKWEYVTLVGVTLCAIVFYLLNFGRFQVGTYTDDGEYVVLARGLTQGKGLALINYPDAPLNTRYPPGYPMLLAPLAAVFPSEVLPLQLLSTLFTAVSIWLVYWFARKDCAPTTALVVSLAFAINPVAVGHSEMVMSEAAYLCLALLALLAFRKYVDSTTWWVIPAASLTVYSFYVRTMSLVLIAAFAIFLLVRRQHNKLIWWIVSVVIALIPYAAYTASVWGKIFNPIYVEQLDSPGTIGIAGDDLGARVIEQLRYYTLNGIPATLLPGSVSPKTVQTLNHLSVAWIIPVLCGVLAAAMAVGAWQLIRSRGLQSVEIFVALYLALLLVWPFHSERFLYPLIPFLYLYFVVGIEASLHWGLGQLSHRLRSLPSSRSATVVVLAFLICITSLDAYQLLNTLKQKSTDFAPDLRAGASWIAENAPKSSIVMTNSPISRYLYTERWTIDAGMGDSEVQILDRIAQRSVDYALIAPKLEWGAHRTEDTYSVKVLEPVLRSHPEQFELVYEDAANLVRVYHRVGSVPRKTPIS